MPKKLSEQIKNKPAKERAKLKGIEIAQKITLKKTKVKAKSNKHGYNFEITDIKAIEKGVEVYARVWENGKQIGMGEDGSVDIERFVFINPPVLVDDKNGDIIKEWTDEFTGELKQRKLKEDPQEAILQTLEHTISVKKQKFDDKNIIKGKIGDTTTTVYPDSGTGATTVDGLPVRTGVNETWANIRTGAGNAHADTTTNDQWAYSNTSGTSNQWKSLFRSIATLDTSPIPNADTISSATFSIYGTNKLDDNSDSPSLALVSSNPASNNDIVNADYSTLGSTRFASDIAYTSWSTTGYNDFTLNASGISAIDKTGITKLGCLLDYDLDAITPTWSAGGGEELSFKGYYADETGTSKDPKLVVEHSAPITAYTATLTESITLSQATTREVNYSKSYTDSVSLTSTVATKNGFFKGLVDTLSLNGIQSTSLGVKKILTDTISLVDSVKTTFLDKLVLTEVISLSDIVDKSYKASVKLKDTLTLTGNLIVGAVRYVQHLIDKISLSDTQTRLVKYAKSFTETITLTGSVTKKMIAHITDSITLTSKRVKIGIGKILTDSISLTDTMSRSTKFIKPLVDSVKVSGKIVKRGWTYAVKNVTNWTWGNKKDQ